MSEIAIRCEGLGKLYRRGRRESYKTLRDAVTDIFLAPVRRWRTGNGAGHAASDGDRFWALKDVSFEVKRGEVVGVIGRNGAGKSTLLKILSRITEPAAGRAEIHGRVGALLEVGTGFHPELTGRENIYLNGAILGMRRHEIERKFDQIVEFAEIGKFLDTPVKHFSSGMYVRLAFAVAAHLEPEILIIDEVLAVGDAKFQEKCLGFMQRTATRGRTVLFVSHNLAAIQSLCSRVVLLENGGIAMQGAPAEVTRHYFSGAMNSSDIPLADWSDRYGSGEARITRLEILDGRGMRSTSVPFGGSVAFTIEAHFPAPIVDPSFGLVVHTAAGDAMLDIRSTHSNWRVGRVAGSVRVTVTVEKLWLYPGQYLVSPVVMDSTCKQDIDYVRFCAALRVAPAPGPGGDDLRLDPNWGKYWIPSDWAQELTPEHAGSDGEAYEAVSEDGR